MSTFLKNQVGGLGLNCTPGYCPTRLYTGLQGPPCVTVVASWSASCLLHCLWLPALEVLKYHSSKVPEAHNWWLGPRPWFLNLPLHTLLQASYSLTPNPSCIFLSACLSIHPCHLCKARSASPPARGCLLRKVSSTPPSCKCSLSPHVSHELHLCLSRALFNFCFVL